MFLVFQADPDRDHDPDHDPDRALITAFIEL